MNTLLVEIHQRSHNQGNAAALPYPRYLPTMCDNAANPTLRGAPEYGFAGVWRDAQSSEFEVIPTPVEIAIIGMAVNATSLL